MSAEPVAEPHEVQCRASTGDGPLSLSIVVPVRDEEANLVAVLSELRQAHPGAEIIVVDDHSHDRSFEILCEQPDVCALRLPRPLGQSAALYCGLQRARGEICVLMDGDGQTSVADIKRLLEHFPEYDFVNGRRSERHDAAGRRLSSAVANAVRNFFTRDGMRDSGGTPKAMKRVCVAHLPPFDGMHRFIPALLCKAGFRTLEIPVAHRPRLHGQTKYTTLDRALRGLWDLFGVQWWLRRRFDPAALAQTASAERPPPEQSGGEPSAQ